MDKLETVFDALDPNLRALVTVGLFGVGVYHLWKKLPAVEIALKQLLSSDGT